MNNYLKFLEKLSAKVALKSAKVASGNASLWGFYQPPEPSMGKLKDKKYCVKEDLGRRF